MARPQTTVLEVLARRLQTDPDGPYLDFEGDKIKNISSGKSTSLEQEYVDKLLGCARERFSNVSLVGIPHEQREYTLFYRLELLAPAGSKPSKPDGGEPATASSAAAEISAAWYQMPASRIPVRKASAIVRRASSTCPAAS